MDDLQGAREIDDQRILHCDWTGDFSVHSLTFNVMFLLCLAPDSQRHTSKSRHVKAENIQHHLTPSRGNDNQRISKSDQNLNILFLYVCKQTFHIS